MSLMHTMIDRAIRAGKRPYDSAAADYPAARARELSQNRYVRVPRSVTVTEGNLNSVPAEQLSSPANPADCVICYIHGGGFVTGSVKTRRAFTGYLAGKLGYNVIAPEYRLAPEAPYPAAPDDCFAAYCALIHRYDPKKVVILGESAGGCLVLETLMRIKEAGLPQPAAAVCIAPVVQFDQILPSYLSNREADSIVDCLSGEITERYLPGADSAALRDPLCAPLYGDFTGCPPVYLWASTSEVLLDDSVVLYEKLKKAGHPCNLYLRAGMLHTWMTIPYYPEAFKDLRRMKQHLDNAFAGTFKPETGIVYLK